MTPRPGPPQPSGSHGSSIRTRWARCARHLPLVALWALLPFAPGPTVRPDDFEKPPIEYSRTTPDDRVARIVRDPSHPLFPSGGTDRQILDQLLSALDVPPSSQVLVFSRTSLQRRRIHPSQPRALYFSRDTYVGWVPGGLIEVASMDPILGPVFYALDPADIRRPDTARERLFVRDNDCLRCHGGPFVRGIPAVFARSVFTDENGEPLLRHGSRVVDHRTPFPERWGGWYVTGRPGATPHRGNQWLDDTPATTPATAPLQARPLDPATAFDASRYPRPGSDILPLLVVEHQMAVHNALTRASHQSRRMLAYQADLQRAFGEPVDPQPTYDSVRRVFDQLADDLTDHFLFVEEAPLPDDIAGCAEFAADHASGVPRCPDGHSLADIRARGRLFVNRCSTAIHSEMFLRLPDPLRLRVHQRIARALSPGGDPPRRAHLDPDERRRITGILRATHPDYMPGGPAAGFLP